MSGDQCPYSIYSLQFYSLFPLIKLAQLFQLPGLLSYVIALFVPAFLLDCFIKKTNCVTLVNHSPHPDHPHSRAITLGVIFRSALLGILCTIGLSFILNLSSQATDQPSPKSGSGGHMIPVGLYIIMLSFFHFSEYFVTSLTNPATLNLSSFLIDNSSAYTIAISLSFAEYLVEVFLFPNSKNLSLVSLLGLVLALAGDLIRKVAMFTAGKNFSHLISSERQPEHTLVTHGIYSIIRHPSYTGWFMWAVGSQILLKNPLCMVLFAIVSYKFFKERVEYEEEMLIEFFGNQYKSYKERVPLGLPLIW